MSLILHGPEFIGTRFRLRLQLSQRCCAFFKWGAAPNPICHVLFLNRSASASAPCGVRSTLFDGRRLPRPPKAPKFPLVRFFFSKTHWPRFCGRGIRKGAFGSRMSSPATTLDIEDEEKLTRSPLKILS